MNLKVKFANRSRPFAPIVRRERVADYFELDAESPYMLLVAPVKRELLPRGSRRRSRDSTGSKEIRFHAAGHPHPWIIRRAFKPWNAKAIHLLYDLLLRFEQAPDCGVL